MRKIIPYNENFKKYLRIVDDPRKQKDSKRQDDPGSPDGAISDDAVPDDAAADDATADIAAANDDRGDATPPAHEEIAAADAGNAAAPEPLAKPAAPEPADIRRADFPESDAVSYSARFREYLCTTKKLAAGSVDAYVRDVDELSAFLSERGVPAPADAVRADIAAYLLHLKHGGRSAATVSRKMASIRAFYRYLFSAGYCTENPSAEMKLPRIAKKDIEYLSIEEVEALLSRPDDSAKGVRDRAILELLYATGLRVSEAVEADTEHINLRMGFVTCTGEHGKARIIPLGRPARAALEAYIFEGRAKLLRGRMAKDKALFLNYSGERMTRQGMWRLIREYAAEAGIERSITPQILRNSFAVHMVQNGADLKSLQELLGHEDPTATQVYLCVSRNRIKDVYDGSHPRA